MGTYRQEIARDCFGVAIALAIFCFCLPVAWSHGRDLLLLTFGRSDLYEKVRNADLKVVKRARIRVGRSSPAVWIVDSARGKRALEGEELPPVFFIYRIAMHDDEVRRQTGEDAPAYLVVGSPFWFNIFQTAGVLLVAILCGLVVLACGFDIYEKWRERPL